MKTRYSKQSHAARGRQQDFLQRNAELNRQSMDAGLRLAAAPLRAGCPLCAAPPPAGSRFAHRGAPYFQCPACGHVASLNDPGRLEPDSGRYTEVYPRLSPEDRRARMDDIYRPKARWVLDVCAEQLGLPPEAMAARFWLETGPGEGLFLKSLEELGVTRFAGLGVEDGLMERSRELLGDDRILTLSGPLGDALVDAAPDVLAAWFVLEHIPDLHALADSLNRLAPGTIFCFAVPVYGLSSLLEAACHAHYPRTLDNRVHTQLFTDQSIDSFLDRSGFTKVAQWVFGQDAADLGRLLGLAPETDAPCVAGARRAFAAAEAELQQTVDRHMLADSRHIVAVKR